jgi:hypothetical protein
LIAEPRTYRVHVQHHAIRRFSLVPTEQQRPTLRIIPGGARRAAVGSLSLIQSPSRADSLRWERRRPDSAEDARSELTTAAKSDESVEHCLRAGWLGFRCGRLNCIAGTACSHFTMPRPRGIVRAWQRHRW